ncbi:MAG: hypothetical protein J6Z36_01950 [Clostridia bacterium]|nr:hypothetical protein [Clostridia bacterium]
MKKIVKTGVAALCLASISLLTACSSSSTASDGISAGWYKDTSLVSVISETYEQLQYEVKFLENSGKNKNYSVSYTPGSYTVTLKNVNYEGEAAYELTSTLEISGVYTVNGETKDFSDFVESVCYFRPAAKMLSPMYSKKTVKSTSPIAEEPSSLAEAVASYDYEVTCDYNADGSRVTVAYLDNIDESKNATKEYKISAGSYFLLDNEELLFAIRGMDLSGSHSVYVFNPYTHVRDTIEISPSTSAASKYSFIDQDAGETEATEHEIPVHTVVFGISSSTLTGTYQAAIYANAIDGKNVYRNVMLYLENPIAYHLGSLTYTLKSANFTDK